MSAKEAEGRRKKARAMRTLRCFKSASSSRLNRPKLSRAGRRWAWGEGIARNKSMGRRTAMPIRIPASEGVRRVISWPASTIISPPAPRFETANHTPRRPSSCLVDEAAHPSSHCALIEHGGGKARHHDGFNKAWAARIDDGERNGDGSERSEDDCVSAAAEPCIEHRRDRRKSRSRERGWQRRWRRRALRECRGRRGAEG